MHGESPIKRRESRKIWVGNVPVGGDAPIAVQSMTNTDTNDVAATVAQIQRLVDAGCRILMPWAAPIGSGLGLLNPWALRTLRARLPDVTLIVDAGLGAPSHATAAMELGMDAVLLNSAVSQSHNPVGMASAFRHAVQGGREGFLSGLMPSSDMAVATTPVGGQPFVLL